MSCTPETVIALLPALAFVSNSAKHQDWRHHMTLSLVLTFCKLPFEFFDLCTKAATLADSQLWFAILLAFTLKFCWLLLTSPFRLCCFFSVKEKREQTRSACRAQFASWKVYLSKCCKFFCDAICTCCGGMASQCTSAWKALGLCFQKCFAFCGNLKNKLFFKAHGHSTDSAIDSDVEMGNRSIRNAREWPNIIVYLHSFEFNWLKLLGF